LIKATKLFDIEARILGEGSGKRFYLRDKRYADA
jgi:hypothetical protein